LMRFFVMRGADGEFQEYEVEATPGLTVLDALFQIRDELDGTLAFRYSCRGAVCGACAMCINGIPRLACRTQVIALQGEVAAALVPFRPPVPGEGDAQAIYIEPLPNMRVIRDLVVDMAPFFERYRKVRPYLRTVLEQDNTGSRMERKKVSELEAYTNCVLCACCTSACPVGMVEHDYLGPAALAKLYRFHIDPREEGVDRLAMAEGPNGWHLCRFHNNCNKVCPKGVRPSYAVGRARTELKESRRS
jgi:succinate dehydrogenase / fumarate reductase iron-sulfur subunit